MLRATVPAVDRGRQRILQPLALALPAGEVLGVIGPNGAGKSTLLRCLAGLAQPVARVTWQGEALGARQIGYLPQAFQIAARLSAFECVLLGRREGLGWQVSPEDLAAAQAVLQSLDLADLAGRSLDTLSGGQQQMVLLAQRLLRAPVLMLLDEPTSALDLHRQLAILRHLRGYARQHGAVVIMALHDLTLAARFCDRLLLLRQGTEISQGPAAEVLSPEAIADCWQVAPEILVDRDGHPVIVPH